MLANGEEVNNSTVAEKMQGKAMPKVQAIDNQTFTVSADDKGDITVKVGEIIVYPTQTDIYDRSKK